MVSNYFNNYDPGYPHYSTTKGKNIGANGGLYNRIGRAYPDVAANGAWTHMYASGTLIREGGTSMAAPLVASIINLINEERLAAGKSTVGFVNPTFYGNPTAFHESVAAYEDHILTRRLTIRQHHYWCQPRLRSYLCIQLYSWVSLGHHASPKNYMSYARLI